MSETTNLKLKKHDNVATNENPMNLEDYLNENWDIIDETFGTANNVIKDLQINVEDLNSENDKQNEDIETLKTDNDTNKENIETNASNIEKNTKDIELNTENIQTNTEDINTLKAQKEALEKEVQNLREDNRLNTLTEDNEGELIHIDNSTGSRFNALEISGNEKQETREGYNLYNVKNLEKVPGQTVDEDDFITLEKTVAQSIDSYMNAHLKVSSALKANTNYWLVIEVKEFSGISKFILNQYLVESKTQIRTDVSLIEANQKAGTYKYKVTTSEDFTGMAYCLRTFAKFNADTTGKIVFRMSLLEQEPDLDTFKYQKYGAMPSFDYPSEVKCVGDNTNLFDKNSITADKYINGTLSGTINDYGDLVNSTVTDTSDFMPVSKDKSYIFSFNYEDLISTNVRGYCFYNKEKQLIESDAETTYNPKNGKIQVSAKQDGYIRISYDKNCTNIKFEQGEKATPYSNYGQGCIQLNIVNKNFLDIEKNSDIEANGLKITTDENGVLTLNGTTTNNLYFSLDLKYLGTSGSSIEQKKFKKGTYVFSSENLSSIIDINLSAYIRKTAAGGEVVEYASLYRPFGSKKKNTKFELEEDVNAVAYLWIASGITLNNAKIKFQIELAEEATDIIANEEQNYVIPVQQRMFKQDKFVKVNGVWKEMHTWIEIVIDGKNNYFRNEITNTSGVYRLKCPVSSLNVKDCDLNKQNKAYCNRSKLIRDSGTYSCNVGFTVNKNIIYMYIDGRQASEINAELQDNPITFYIPLQEDSYQYLDCTKEQTEILNKIEQEAHTYSEVTNIYTEDEVGAIIKTNTAVDLKTVINNIQEQLIAE